MAKSADAFRTISEVAELLQVPAHVLRFWESRFAQVKPVKRAGGRRYYRPGDIRLLAGIRLLLHDDGMTIKGVQKILREHGVQHVAGLAPALAEIQADEAPAGAEVLSFTRRPGGPDPDDPDEHVDEHVDEAALEDATGPIETTPDNTGPYGSDADAPEPYAPVSDDDLPADAPGPARQDAPEAAPPVDALQHTAEDPADPAPQAAAPLPPLPDLPDDPPDTVAATPGALTALAGLRGPVPADLASRLQALADRLHGPDADRRTNQRAGD
ncbi:MerR family transcriptional regulator [Roseovarius sp. D22-M7]|uniref:MerR family transcriptional regulator n=1 Tax=Roseovarius sp. D22-M7 TaxID=3127116 RepID=UPI00300FBDDB